MECRVPHDVHTSSGAHWQGGAGCGYGARPTRVPPAMPLPATVRARIQRNFFNYNVTQNVIVRMCMCVCVCVCVCVHVCARMRVWRVPNVAQGYAHLF